MMGNVYRAVVTSSPSASDCTGAQIAVTDELKHRFWVEVVQAFLHHSRVSSESSSQPTQLGGLAREQQPWGKAVVAQVFLDLLRTCHQGTVLLEHVEDAMMFHEFQALVGDEWPEEELSVDEGLLSRHVH
jgi:hypothetical protein